MASNGTLDQPAYRSSKSVGGKALFAGVAFVLLATYALSTRTARQMPDFEVYWRAGVRAAAGEPLYRAEDQHYQFKYLPAFAVLAIPIGLLPLPIAKTLWRAASISCLLLLIVLSVRLPIERRKQTWIITSIVIVTMGKFFGHELVLGQVNLLFGLVAVAALLSLKDGRDLVAGLLIALAIVIKPYAVIFLPWIAIQQRPKAVIAAAAGLLVSLSLPAAAYSPRETAALHGQWWQTVATSTAPNLLNQDNVSLAAMFAKWLGPGTTASYLTGIAAVVLLAAAVVVLIMRRQVAFPEGLEGALLLTLIPLLSPQGWDYVFLIATPAVVYLANYEDRLPGAARALIALALAAIGLSLFDLLGRATYARFMALSIITWCFLIVVGGLVALRIRRIA